MRPWWVFPKNDVLIYAFLLLDLKFCFRWFDFYQKIGEGESFLQSLTISSSLY
ncbi:hypothetical protein Syun_006708 [Stephania yunnanensis]|uniref:Uncharacterized protein n=1 Tax=Stephania yunnanensis TaxID=152371 RepID=A0AAP0KYS9_9MAGN